MAETRRAAVEQIAEELRLQAEARMCSANHDDGGDCDIEDGNPEGWCLRCLVKATAPLLLAIFNERDDLQRRLNALVYDTMSPNSGKESA